LWILTLSDGALFKNVSSAARSVKSGTDGSVMMYVLKSWTGLEKLRCRDARYSLKVIELSPAERA
jgi:hypothetical protein